MRALVYTQPHKLEMQQIADPCPGPGEVLVRVRAAGVCGSDLDGFLGHSKKRRPPLVLGHEFAGDIAALGSGVREHEAGDRVAVFPLLVCGECEMCRSGRPQICARRKLFGLDFHGGLAEYVAVPEGCLFQMPEGVSHLEGALVEPLANALHVLSHCGDIRGKTGLIYGSGSIGVITCWAAHYLGARQLAVVDLNPARLAIAKTIGADLTVDPASQDVVKTLLDWTGGNGVQFSVDAVGRDVCRRHTILCTAVGGSVAWIGLAEDEARIDARAVVTREIEIRGSYAYAPNNFEQALELIASGVFPAGALVTERPLDKGQEVFEELTSGASRLVKVVFQI
jgi:threonine dehydrogenase-like Zn-dependent dehydrogenase